MFFNEFGDLDGNCLALGLELFELGRELGQDHSGGVGANHDHRLLVQSLKDCMARPGRYATVAPQLWATRTGKAPILAGWSTTTMIHGPRLGGSRSVVFAVLLACADTPVARKTATRAAVVLGCPVNQGQTCHVGSVLIAWWMIRRGPQPANLRLNRQ